MDSARLDALLLLSLTPGLGPTLTRRCLEALGSPQAVLDAPARALAGVEGLGPQRAQAIRAGMDALADGKDLAREKELMARYGVSVLAVDEPDYPKLLRHIPDPPPLLYVRGRILERDALALAVVGARRCTHYGREQADRLGAACAQAGLCIVSGGAYGVDASAHRAALRVRGRTIAVLGSGLAKPYPAEHAPLFDQIASPPAGADGDETGGAVVSELPMSAPPLAENFPRRNRIISGLALGVLVVEASLRSGALITARLCSEEHNREVMALPGRVDADASAGCHKIIREGWATLVTSAADVLDALGETGAMLKADLLQPAAGAEGAGQRGAGSAAMPSLFDQSFSDSQRRIVAALDEPRSLDQLVAATGLSVPTVQADLTMLQIRGTVTRAAGQYVRRR